MTGTRQRHFKRLKDHVDDRLAEMMSRNPARINYYERYQKIIEEFNVEQDKAAIEKTFIDLASFVNDLADEELAIYDLLLKDSLTPNEIKKIKELSRYYYGIGDSHQT